MSAEIRIDPQRMLRHAARVERLAGDAAEAAAAIRSINLGGGAFGVMCAWMVAPIGSVSGAVSSMIVASERVIDHAATELRGVVGDFEAHERHVVDSIEQLERGLGQ